MLVSIRKIRVKRAIPTILILSVILCAAAWHFRRDVSATWEKGGEPLRLVHAAAPKPDAARYTTMKEDVERWRKDFAKRHAEARSAAEKDRVLAEARRFLETVLPEMMRCWLGTRWDFNGTAELPGEGKIACGYFVSTVMRDAGFRVDRYKLARQSSQSIIRSFLPRAELDLKIGVPYETYAAGLETAEPGIRIVGLDSHVAFLVTGPEGFRFIHSSGSKPWCVVDEGEADAEVLRRSNYRVQGLLTADKELLLQWLAGTKIAIKEDRPAAARATRR